MQLSITHDFPQYAAIMIQEVKPTKPQDLEAIRILAQNELHATSFFNCTIPNTPEHLSPSGIENGTHPRGGVAIILQPSFPGHESAYQMEGEIFDHPILRNRYICIRLDWDDNPVFLHSVYAPVTMSEQARFFQHLPRSDKFPANAIHIAGGDFNLPFDTRLDSRRSINRYYEIHNQNQLREWLYSLNLKDEWRIQHPTTRWITAQQQRVDYIFTSTTLRESHKIHPSIRKRSELQTGDHDAPSIHFSYRQRSKGTGYWKCPLHTLSKHEIQTHIRREARILLQRLTQDQTLNALTEWATFKVKQRRYLQHIQKSDGHSLTNRITEEWTRCKIMIHQQSTRPHHPTLHHIQQSLAILSKLIKRRKSIMQRRSFQRSVQQAETSTKYFFRKPQNYSVSPITSVLTDDGSESQDISTIRQQHATTWKRVWGEIPEPHPPTQLDKDRATQTLLDIISKTLNQEEINLLSADISANEIVNAIRQGANHSSPGMDGLPFEYFKVDPTTFGALLHRVYHQASIEGSFHQSSRKSAISLLYKKGLPADPANYRPIAIMPVDAKLLDSLLNKRIITILPRIIHSDQKGFMKNRSIHENLVFIQECQHYATKNELPWLAQFLDFQKAYDRVDWSFLWKVMHTMRFPQPFINWVKMTYNCNQYVLNINGWLTETVHPRTGIKQGSPLSPALFTIVVEPLHQLLRQNAYQLGIPLSTRQYKILDAFADDTTLYAQSSRKADQQLNLVQTYCVASNAKLNIHKTTRLLLDRNATSSTHSDQIQTLTPQESTLYLGLLIGQKTTAEQQIAKAQNKFEQRLSIWKYRARTIPGRKTLIHAVMLSTLWYLLAVVSPPSSTTQTINRKSRTFLLTRQVTNNRKQLLMQKDWVHAQTTMGGLGLLDADTTQQRDRINLLKRMLNSNLPQENSWLALITSQLSRYSNDIPFDFSGINFLWFNYKTLRGKEIFNQLSPFLQSIITTWSNLPKNTSFPNCRNRTKWLLNIPLLHNYDPTWSIQTRLQTPRYSLMKTLHQHRILRSMGDLLLADGTWISCQAWTTKVNLFFREIMHSDTPDPRTIRNLFHQLDAIKERHFGDICSDFPCNWKNTPLETWNWPWSIESRSQGPAPFTDCSSKILYNVLETVPKSPHPYTRFNIEGAPHPTIHQHCSLKRWISPITRNVIYRMQTRLLPLGYTRQHTNDPTMFQCPLCANHVETYSHLFWECTVSRNLWSNQLQKWHFSPATNITWTNIIFPSTNLHNPSWGFQSHEYMWLWWVQVGAVCHYIWTLRNAITFEHLDIPQISTQTITVNCAITSHLDLVLHAAETPFPKSKICELMAQWALPTEE